MKVRVLWPTPFLGFMDAPPEAGAIVTVDPAHGADLIRMGAAEEVRASRTETTSAGPDKPRATRKPRRKAAT